MQKAPIVKSFLTNPGNRKNFNPFFKLIYSKAVIYIYKLKASGWPISIKDADTAKSIADYTFDILGGFLQSRPNQPFFIIFEYFRRHGISEFENEDEERLHSLLLILLTGFIKKEIPRLNKFENPQIANLKRGIKDILKSQDYEIAKIADFSKKSVYLKSNVENLRADRNLITKEQLFNIVENAFNLSKTRPKWCRKIFDLINEETDCRNQIDYYELIQAMIAVNSIHVELDGNYCAGLPDPEMSLIHKTAQKAKEYAFEAVRANEIAHFIKNGRISSSEAELFEQAVEKFLTDLSCDGGYDSKPTYFREVMPENYHARYLNDYKFIFETIINKAEDYFKEYMKRNL